MTNIHLPAEIIRQLQTHIKAKIVERGFDDETTHERLLLLVEEVGELVKACRKITGMNVKASEKPGEKVGAEIVDVLNMLFAVAVDLGIDVEQEFYAKEKIIDQRVYTRSQSKLKE